MCGRDNTSRVRTSIVLVRILLALILSVGCAAAALTELQISPKNPKVGDSVTISGKASPNEVLSAEITFIQNVTVSNGEYKYDPGKISMPAGTTNSIITAEGVKNLAISTNILGIKLSRSFDASADTATVSMPNIPKGRYNLVISGEAAGQDQVQLTMTAKINIKADKKGKFKYSYKTDYVPPGKFTIKIEDQTKEVTLSSKGGPNRGGGTGEARILEGQTQPESTLTAPPEVPSESNVTEQMAPPVTQPNETTELVPPVTEPQTFMDSLRALFDRILKLLGSE